MNLLQLPLERSFTAALDALPECVKVLSAGGQIEFVNSRGLEVMEASSIDRVLGKNYAELWPPDRHAEIADAVRRASRGAHVTIRGHCPTLMGNNRCWETLFSALDSSHGARVVGMTREISDTLAYGAAQADHELRRLAAELSEAERRKTEFIATLAHELRNPLAPVRTGLQILAKANDRATIAKVHSMMERQLGHMVHLINDLLDVARVTSGKMSLQRQRVDLHVILNAAIEATQSLVSAAGHRLTVDAPQTPIELDADATRLTQVFTNLLSNAVKYTANGGCISIAATADARFATIVVEDSGIGLSPKSLTRIFDMFTRVGTSASGLHEGLGVGLNLVRRLVELHAGTVVAHSKGIGQGSTFVVTLPRARHVAATSVAERSAVIIGAVENPVRILVVDDNDDAAQSLSMLLESDNHLTRVENSGKAALGAVQEFKPEIIFLDIGMPVMNGYDVARSIRAMCDIGNPILIALTGWGSNSDRERTLHAGFDAHLTKPADIADIERMLTTVRSGDSALRSSDTSRSGNGAHGGTHRL